MSVTRARQQVRAREHRAATERAILDATESLLASRAFRDLTVEDVMAVTGLTRTAFYRYFPDLEAVLMRRLGEIHSEISELADQWLDPASDPIGALSTPMIGMARLFHDHGRLMLAFSDAAGGGPEIEAAWKGMIEAFIGPILQRIETLTAAGLVDLDNPEETIRALVGMNERYLLNCYGQDRDVPVLVSARTLVQIWRRVLFSRE